MVTGICGTYQIEVLDDGRAGSVSTLSLARAAPSILGIRAPLPAVTLSRSEYYQPKDLAQGGTLAVMQKLEASHERTGCWV